MFYLPNGYVKIIGKVGMREKIRVAVAMSGGVDSSVAAALLKKKGYEVIGLTMQLWPREQLQESARSCCGSGAVEDARRVAAALGIAHYVINTREIFEKKVVEPFCQSYLQGMTPNPCIRCNEFVKFVFLLQKAKALKADCLATGHYAQIRYSRKDKRYHLLQGSDRYKDQSYFLYTLTQNQLAHILFPLGNYTKKQVRIIAGKMKLPTAKRPESQEICFIPDNDYHRFIRERLSLQERAGAIKNKAGVVLGQHKGLAFYTIGQRKGLGIAYKEPLYVVDIDVETNTLIVGVEKEVYKRVLVAEGVNYVSMAPAHGVFRARAKIRSRQLMAGCTIMPLARRRIKVVFNSGQWAITPGQAVVFYDKSKVLGGGTIVKAVSN